MLDNDPLHKEFGNFLKALSLYFIFRLTKTGLNFEEIKDFIVDLLLLKRGAHTSLFVHGSILALALIVLIGGGIISPNSVVSGSYPGVDANPMVAANSETVSAGVISSSVTPITIISDKPRDKVIEYEVKQGDTISKIAQEYAVSEETILWENGLSKNSRIKEGQELKILPVSGVLHKVEGGDTIYSIAKNYRANAQAILDFPFNDVGDNFTLSTGQSLIIPDGAPPEKAKPAPTQYLAKTDAPTGPVSASGQFAWPASGEMAQYFSWYHPALDISNLGGGPIRASDSGRVTMAGWPDASGYGNRVLIDHGNGYTTLYAHMSAIYVGVGQSVGKGEVLGMMGSTGRSTGTHVHLEIRQNGAALNPLGLLSR